MAHLLEMRPPSTALLPRGFVPSSAAPLVRVGRTTSNFAAPPTRASSSSALTKVGGPVANTVAGAMYVAVAAAWGLFSYSLFTGKWLWQAKHPGWGVVTGLVAASSLLGAADAIKEEPARS